ncbi:MAG: winged helix-turn-helix transcriptional regulator [Thermoplasmata archaeon]|nr:winged helix-turn-helix transcriptional regulator [Thermoplasmata archaeon]RLF26821.1 MAG: ArsR family transcriptional regulator [Thermoplasmata archaeon]
MHAVKRLLWWLLAGSVGGFNRGRILEVLLRNPSNAHELSQVLKLDYKTVRHHIEVLEKNRLITSMGADYGKVYFPSDLLEEHVDYFNEIWGKIGKKEIRRK